ncbi:MAG TPA: hypothetical protein VGS05_13785 [Candidatus Sulfotelmatobacter sp.]|nr:hypothetical protein [Candidatus Sulfotelmatobacter sp.]
MTCIELQESLAENETGGSVAQRAHLRDCPQCAALVAELLVIACAAGELRACNEPSPRVWNSIEIALRKEGVIRPQHEVHSFFPAFTSMRTLRWLLPVAAALLVTAGVLVQQHLPSHSIANNEYAEQAASGMESDAALAGLNDDDLIQEIAQQSPAVQAQYTENLRRVNQYILDARSSVAADPNDEEAHRSLMDAYQQKAMLFELALDRSLP